VSIAVGNYALRRYHIVKNEKAEKKNHMVQPPFSKNVKTNIARKFLQLIDKHFPRSSRLYRIFNRNSVKVSYSCMSNITSDISNRNRHLPGKKNESEGTGNHPVTNDNLQRPQPFFRKSRPTKYSDFDAPTRNKITETRVCSNASPPPLSPVFSVSMATAVPSTKINVSAITNADVSSSRSVFTSPTRYHSQLRYLK
jgi:hypothetical protein